MTVKEIIEQHLKAGGFDGLFVPGECSCLLDDLCVCDGCMLECQPGFLLDGDEDCDFYVGPYRQFHAGDHVHYIPNGAEDDPKRWEKGMVKSKVDDQSAYFVVYNCAGDWDNYWRYTGCSTHARNMRKGWKEDK